MRIIFALLLLLLPGLSSPALADASDISAATRSVVRVAVFSNSEGQRTFIGHGSGVVVAPDKIITNAHVVDPAQYDESVTFVIIPSEGARSYEAKVIARSSSKDLALLQVSGARLVPASIYSGVVGDGSDVFAIGYPANVDIALEQNEEDTLRPQTPVKTRGSVSSGRTSKSVESLLHTAPIAPGHSGGPLVDACGRVVGINSFGSTADGGGAEFYFAVSARELSQFLSAQNVSFKPSASECRSVAEMTRTEAEREAAARAKIEADNRLAAELRGGREGKLRRDAEYAVIAERENHVALTGLLLVLAAVSGGVAWQLLERGQRQNMKIAASVGGLLVFSALMAFLLRPSFDEVEDRVRAAMVPDAEPAAAVPQKTVDMGKKRCVIQPDRSRITVSETADIEFTWTGKGCVNQRTQYAENAGSWLRSFVPNEEAQVSLVSYAPDSNTYRIERYLLGMDAMEKAREARRRYEVTSCSADAAVRDKIDNMNKAVREVLPATPNELLVFSCSDQ